MSKRNKFKYVIISFAILFLCIACFLVLNFNKTDILIGYAESGQIKSKYLYGEELQVPSVNITYGENQIQSQGAYVVFPNGKAVEKEKISLTLEGEYSIVYYAETDNKYIEAKENFTVCRRLYNVNNVGSSAKIGKTDQYEQSGIVLSLAKGDVFNYNKPINLTGYTNADPIISFFTTPETIGVADCMDVLIRLTDAYDENNYIELMLSNVSHLGPWADPYIYVKGGSNNQKLSGLQGGQVRTDYCGLSKAFSLTGIRYEDNPFIYYIDYAEKKLWTNGGTPDGNCKEGYIIDLDEPTHFETLWNGFTTGECFLSIYGKSYRALNLNLLITNIDGLEMVEEQTLPSENQITINVDYANYSEADLPKAKVGKPYKLFNATAESLYENNIEITANVYYNYGSKDALTINVVDGAFVPLREGNYSIKYVAKDSFGNETVKIVDVYAEVFNDLNVNYNVLATSGKIAEKIKLLEIESVENFSGNTKYNAYAKLGEKVFALNEDFIFTPEYSGEYTIVFTCGDYVEETTSEFKFSVSAQNVSKIMGETFVPKNLIKDATYNLENLKAINYSSGEPKEIPTKIYVSEDDKTEFEITGNKYTVNASNKVKIIYRATQGVAERVYESIVHDVNYGKEINISNYFLCTNGNVTMDEENNFLLATCNEDSMIEFINPVDVNNLSLAFKTSAVHKDFDTVNIYLEDCISGKKIKFTYKDNGAQVNFFVNDSKAEYPILGDFDAEKGSEFKLLYNNLNFEATPNRSNYVLVDSHLDGTSFNGFVCGKAYLSIEFKNVNSTAGITINNVNGHTMLMSNKNKDAVKPVLETETVVGDRKVGDIISIKSANIFDVLDPYCEGSLVIYTPSNNFLVDDNGVVFDGTQSIFDSYNAKLDELGEYEISYLVVDGAGNRLPYTYYIRVVDTEPPMITLDSIKDEVSAGKEYSFSSYTVTDNCSSASDIKVYLFVVDTKNTYIEITEERYVFEEKGKYKVVYMVVDEMFNMQVVEYDVVVK